MSMVSLNLAIFNLLPIPILDGGVILMLLIEMLMRRDLSLNVKEAVFKVGFVFIMVVVAFVIYNDILQDPAAAEIDLNRAIISDLRMECSCVRQTELPHTTKLFADLLYHPRPVRRVLSQPAVDPEALRGRRRDRFLPDQRAALVAALREQNGDSAVARPAGQAGNGGGGHRPAGGAVFRSGLHHLQSADRGEAGARADSRAASPPFRSSGWPPKTTISPK